jgi:DNA-binding response OmpR family regulator
VLAFSNAAAGETPRILVVDDDEGTRRTFQLALHLNGFSVATAGSGLEAMQIAAQTSFDLILLDLRLGDVSGIDVIRSLPDRARQPFILMSAFLSTDTTVEAMRLGAFDVLEKPLDVDRMVTRVSAALERRGAVERELQPAPAPEPVQAAPALPPPRTAAERWARYVLKACDAETDPKTLERWSQCVAASYTTLCVNCRIMGIRPLDARDFMRVLRALRRAATHHSPPEVFLDVSDTRTVRMLSLRAGIDLALRVRPSSIDEFLARQLFVSANNQGLGIVREFVNAGLLK